jgi:hypothetical protein
MFKKNHGVPLFPLNSWGANTCERVIQEYMMHMTEDITQENEKGLEATHKLV